MCLLHTVPVCAATSAELETGFRSPPPSARPWVYWFWLDGNITREGITADLEAIARVGLGGALIMDVSQGIPPGPVKFFDDQWRNLFKHAVSEAARLNLQIGLHNASGWCGSGGPWINTEIAMQKVVWSKTNLVGPIHYSGPLPPLTKSRTPAPETAVLAYPALRGDTRNAAVFPIPGHQTKTGMGREPSLDALPAPPADAIIARESVRDISSHLRSDGVLDWEVPAGTWTILRFGSMPTGRTNHPARPNGVGLECDKLSRQAVEAHFNAFLKRLITDAGDEAGKTFTQVHVDSWEVGFQNWTPEFVKEFRALRGYDPLPWFPVFSGRYIGSADVTQRFLWDARRTISDLQARNYAGHLAELAHQNRMTLSIEAYGNGPFDNLMYAARADIPMSEFWLENDGFSGAHYSKTMASAAHTCGKPFVAAEAFTAWPFPARWQNHPGTLKSAGDANFCLGVNHLVFHRFAHQPWTNRAPGMTMGQLGIHYERTATWWEKSAPWHAYLSRCQFLLQHGLFAADLCYLTPETAYCEPPYEEKLSPPPPRGYSYDLISPEAVITRMSVREGRLVLPDGMGYCALVLPPSKTMTPELLEKLAALVRAGAVLVGPRPEASPSLAGYPECDAVVQRLGREVWGNCDGDKIKNHQYGSGRVFWGAALDQILAGLKIRPDFQQSPPVAAHALQWIHRRLGEADFYFVANPSAAAVSAECQFRVQGRQPELWDAETGEIRLPALWREQDGRTIVPLELGPAGSVFVAFRTPSKTGPALARISHQGKPAPFADVQVKPDGKLTLATETPGRYELVTPEARLARIYLAPFPRPLTLEGPWTLRFPPGSGAPDSIQLPRLMPWNLHSDPGVRFFSGTAIYFRNLNLPREYFGVGLRQVLNLGNVQVIAEVKVNGKAAGILWKAPFITDITNLVQPGTNNLEIAVVNLWPNRLIGDEQLPADCLWLEDPSGIPVSLKEWPQWLLEGKPSPTGRITFTTWKHWQKDSPLLPSGLIGPVTLSVSARAQAEFPD